jgi:hypothetical protein
MNVVIWLQKLALNIHIPMLVAIGLAYCWLLAGYGVMFWHTRHSYALKRMAEWTIVCSVFGYGIYYFTDLGEIASRILALAFGLMPPNLVYRYWVGRVKAPGYAHSRELLLFHAPTATV